MTTRQTSLNCTLVFFTASVAETKASLAKLLSAGGCHDIHPDTWDAQIFLKEPPVSTESEVFFLKHSLGVKGTGVNVYRRAALMSRLNALGPKGCEPFVVQRCVAPPALRNGRKWVIRAHALLHGKTDGRLCLFLHNEMISLEYGQVYTEQPEVKAAHVSNSAKIKYLPKPELVQDDSLIQQLRSLTQRLFASVLEHVPRGPFTPKEAELCQIFGLDVILDGMGKAWLLEVNDYPAIASGTMEHVDLRVYTNLVRDVLRLVVLPKVDGTVSALGGWHPIKLPAVAGCAKKV